MAHSNKKQKVGDNTTCKEESTLYNTDTLTKIISYLPSVDLLSLALTSKRFGASNDDNDSLIEESTRIAIQDIATEEQLSTPPYYNGENSLANYHYLQLMRGPLAFDQLIRGAGYVSGNKTCVRQSGNRWATAISNKILRVGKHYVTFEARSFTPDRSNRTPSVQAGVMRPGQVNQNACGTPHEKSFFKNFSQRFGQGKHTSNVHCCLYYTYNGKCYSSDWVDPFRYVSETGTWDGLETMSSDGDEIGMLLDLDEGTLSVYKNGRKLGVMKRGLAGPYCWVVSLFKQSQVTIKQGTIPPS